DVGGVISAGGSGNTALATSGMRRVPVGVPKIMISTVASGEVGRYVGASDILMMHSVADVQGLNSITEQILGNGAHALAGMMPRLPTAAERAAQRRRRAAPPPPAGAQPTPPPCCRQARPRHHHVRRDHALREGADGRR